MAQIVGAVHIPGRVTTSIEMSIPLRIAEARKFRYKAANLQFVVGQDEAGRWVVVERHGRGGGIFVDRQAAVKYAASEAGQRPDAVRFSKETLTIWSQPNAVALVA